MRACVRACVCYGVGRVRDNVFQNSHADVGLITAAPLAAQPGLQLLQQVPAAAAAAAAAQGSGGGFKWEWVSVEGGGNASEEVRAPFKFVALVAADDFTKKS